MTTHAPTAATPPPVEVIDAEALVTAIEEYLTGFAPAQPPAPAASQPVGPRTAHPLVTKTTAELVAEATGHALTPTAAAPDLRPPGRIARLIPHSLLRVPGVRRLHGGIRQITVEQHLHLTALMIERGWARHSYRTVGGRMCIQGAQRMLYALGYGDHDTASQAANRIQGVLRTRGINQLYPDWNDGPDRTVGEILNVIRSA